MKKLFIAITVLFVFNSAQACEICGCGLGNYYIGIMPQFSHRFVGLRYHYNHFSTRLHDDPSQFSNDWYHTAEVWTGFNIGKRFQVLAFLPFNFVHQKTDEGSSNRSGLGDVAFLLNYKLLDKSSGTGSKKIQQQLYIGGGIKLATGTFDIDPADPDVAAAANSQLGTGSTDYMVNAMYNLHRGRFGFSANANYKINGSNDADYTFGNKFAANTFFYYSLPAPTANMVLTPSVGFLAEHANHNTLAGSELGLTGGSLYTVAGGLDINFGKTSLGFNAQLPVSQQFAEGQTQARVKAMVHLTFSL